MKSTHALSLLFFSLSVVFAFTADAANNFGTRWNSNPTFIVHNGDFGYGASCSWATQGGSGTADLMCAAEGWSYGQNGGSWLTANISYGNAGSYSGSDNVNGVYTLPHSEFDPGVMAFATRRTSGGFIVESDILFDSSIPWRYGSLSVDAEYFGPNPLVGDERSFRTVATHEMGHAIGVAHTAGVLAVMNPEYPNGGRMNYQNNNTSLTLPLADDRQVIEGGNSPFTVGIYQFSPATIRKDIGVSPWIWSSGEINAIIDNAGPAVCPGQNYPISYTVMNRSNVDVANVKVQLFFSTDRTITVYDQSAGALNYSLIPKNHEYRYTSSLFEVPWYIQPGEYWLGAIADYNDSVSPESWEHNNRTVLHTTKIIVSACP